MSIAQKIILTIAIILFSLTSFIEVGVFLSSYLATPDYCTSTGRIVTSDYPGARLCNNRPQIKDIVLVEAGTLVIFLAIFTPIYKIWSKSK